MSIRQGGKVIAGNTSGHNVGDVFWTMRKSNTLNGAVMCNGATYDTDDFSGAQCIGELLESGEVPYVSLADYATALTNDGVVGVFGWDGVGTTTFRVPTLQDVFIEAGTAAQLGDFVDAGLPNITGYLSTGFVQAQTGDGAFSVRLPKQNRNMPTGSDSYQSGWGWDFSASDSNSTYGNSNTVQPRAVRYRPMVQLATGATDEALETCTNVLAMMANADFVIERQDPTAGNGYTWYRKYKSGWVEQGGFRNYTTSPLSITLPVEMADTNYTAVATESNSGGGCWAQITNKTTTTVSVGRFYASGSSGSGGAGKDVNWQVSGMAA